MVTRAEAAALAAGNPLSFLHVGRAEIDLPPGTDPHDERVYAKAKANLAALQRDGVLIQEAAPTLYLYELTLDGHVQSGIVGCVHVDDYARNVIRRHENTRRDKEDDRTRHMLALRAHAEPVLLAHKDSPLLKQAKRNAAEAAPLYDFSTEDGIRHRFWRLGGGPAVADAFRRLGAAYMADGHHRSASAVRAAAELRAAGGGTDDEFNWFPAVLFPASELRILGYHRVVRDLGGLSTDEFLARLAGVGTLAPGDGAPPERAGVFGVCTAKGWHRLSLDPDSIDQRDPIGSLDVSLLHQRVLAPILGIGDIRTDPRIDFVGGIRGMAELARRVSAGEAAAAFALHPVTMQQLMTIADAGAIMPPKSTWFEPKLKSGLFVHSFD